MLNAMGHLIELLSPAAEQSPEMLFIRVWPSTSNRTLAYLKDYLFRER
jgi:hypothetical protein